MSREYPFKWVDVSDEEVKRVFRQPKRQYIKSIPGDVWMPKNFGAIAEKIYNFEVRPDDIWIVTYPKCGTTWTQELIWQITHNVDIEYAKANPILARSPFLEFEIIAPQELSDMMVDKAPDDKKHIIKAVTTSSVDYAHNLESPRIIKSHLPLQMLPPEIFSLGCKVIYVCRNPKDACVSFFHHNRLMKEDFVEDFDHQEEMFLNGTFMYGNYWYHIKEAYKHKVYPNFKLVWYEDMKRDLISIIREMAKFLEVHLTELRILTLDDFLYIGNQRKDGISLLSYQRNEEARQMMRVFFRKGMVGDWKNNVTEEKLDKWNKWIEENSAGTDIKIVWE